jgi:hypothetical protein
MIQWPLGLEGAFRFEVSGTWVMCDRSRLRQSDLVSMLASTKQFVGPVQRVVFELYGT